MPPEDNDRMEAELLAHLDEDDAMAAIQVMRDHTVPVAAYRGAVEALANVREALLNEDEPTAIRWLVEDALRAVDTEATG